jgi:hypothetical protein
MKLRIEIREGPASMYNPRSNLYVVAIHPEIGPKDQESGQPLGEKVIGGPMSEFNAMGMIEHIRRSGLPPDALQDSDNEPLGHDIEELDLPPPPPEPEPVKPSADLIIPLAYLAGIGLFVVMVVYVLGLR